MAGVAGVVGPSAELYLVLRQKTAYWGAKKAYSPNE